jgi:oxygen-independent coproporphyrinogen-3 oxidase
MSNLQLDAELIARYDCAGPRYTSYPTALQFHGGFDEVAYRHAAWESEGHRAQEPISLYVHVPFCASPCFYCGCNRIITRSPERAEAYLHRLHREVEMQGALFGRQRCVEQLHFGGGTPTFLSQDQLALLMRRIGASFALTPGAQREYSIEIDPRTVTPERVRNLADLGFNRMSLGVQDFDPRVQRAVNRLQSVEQTLEVMQAARACGFGSIAIDLIYGLPKQTGAGFTRTLDTVIAARPDRLAVYGYAHMPQVFKAQRRLSAQDLPSPPQRLELLRLTIEALTGAGYDYIGMDHFALPTDELVEARKSGTLQRNFQGYSTRARCDLVGLGVSAIGSIGRSYAQNARTLPEYYAAIDAGHLPIRRGLTLDADDLIRRAVIQELMCQEAVGFAQMNTRFGIDFERYFAAELWRLEALAADGLVALGGDAVRLMAKGRLLMRNVAMVFDAYLGRAAAPAACSRAI